MLMMEFGQVQAQAQELLNQALEQKRSWMGSWIFKWFTTISGGKHQTRIELPPGATMLQVTKIFVSKKHYERVLEPVIADWRAEYFEAVDENAHWLTFASIRVRNVFYFLTSLGLLGAAKLLLKLIKSISSS